jgi:biopolymer transport protein ExbB
MWELFVKARWVGWPLGLFSILALAIILERLFTLYRLKQLEERAFMMLQLALEKEDDEALQDKQLVDAPVTQVMSILAPMRGSHRDAIQNAADVALSLQRQRLRRYLGTLATIGSTSPFIGLFGTVLGVMQAFQSMSHSGLSGEGMAAGISEALSATALGLLVAIPAVMAYNFLLGRVQGLLLQVQGHVARLTPLLEDRPRVKQEA